MPSPSTASSGSTETIQVGRQAIFDRELEVGPANCFYRDAGGAVPLPTVTWRLPTVLNAFMEIGLDRITGPYKAFINLTRPFFVDMPPIPFDRDRRAGDPRRRQRGRRAPARHPRHGRPRLRTGDGRLQFQPWLQPILPLVSYIKVEIQPAAWRN